MYCLNCGCTVDEKRGNCSNCNIDLKSHGSIEDLKFSFHKVNSIKSSGFNCVNCLEELPEPHLDKCPSCNYKFRQTKPSNGIYSSNLKNSDRSFYKQEDGLYSKMNRGKFGSSSKDLGALNFSKTNFCEQ